MARVLVPIADGSEELEAVTLIDLVRRAGFEVVVAGIKHGPVTCSRGVVVAPDVELGAVAEDEFDVVVLPGGTAGADRLGQDERLQRLLARHRDADGWTAAICAAPGLLAQQGLLAGRRATAFPGALEAMGASSTGEAVEFDGRVATSRGPGTAMDFALDLIEALASRECREQVEARLQR